MISCVVLYMIATTYAGLNGQPIAIPYGNSPSAMVSQTIGLTDITVAYSRPRVIDGDEDKTGKIWGGHVFYGFQKINFGYEQEIPWNAGQNKNTTISFEHDVKINGNELKAGTYGLYMAVYEDGKVTLIFSNNANSWESFWYHPDNDVLRVETQMEDSPFVNSLTYSFDEITDNSCELALTWENKRIPFTIEVNVHEIALASFEEDMKSTAGFGAEGPAAAAEYLLREEIYLDQALMYAQWAINNGRTIGNLILKATILIKTGEEEESSELLSEIAEEANAWQLYFLSRDLISYEKQEKARDLLKSTMKKNGEEAVVHLALGEAYKANDQLDLAMKSARKALDLEPDPFIKSNAENLVKELESML